MAPKLISSYCSVEKTPPGANVPFGRLCLNHWASDPAEAAIDPLSCCHCSWVFTEILSWPNLIKLPTPLSVVPRDRFKNLALSVEMALIVSIEKHELL